MDFFLAKSLLTCTCNTITLLRNLNTMLVWIVMMFELPHLHLKESDWMAVCLLSAGGSTVEPTQQKFGEEDHIYPEEVIGYTFGRVDPPTG